MWLLIFPLLGLIWLYSDVWWLQGILGVALDALPMWIVDFWLSCLLPWTCPGFSVLSSHQQLHHIPSLFLHLCLLVAALVAISAIIVCFWLFCDLDGTQQGLSYLGDAMLARNIEEASRYDGTSSRDAHFASRSTSNCGNRIISRSSRVCNTTAEHNAHTEYSLDHSLYNSVYFRSTAENMPTDLLHDVHVTTQREISISASGRVLLNPEVLEQHVMTMHEMRSSELEQLAAEVLLLRNFHRLLALSIRHQAFSRLKKRIHTLITTPLPGLAGHARILFNIQLSFDQIVTDNVSSTRSSALLQLCRKLVALVVESAQRKSVSMTAYTMLAACVHEIAKDEKERLWCFEYLVNLAQHVKSCFWEQIDRAIDTSGWLDPKLETVFASSKGAWIVDDRWDITFRLKDGLRFIRWMYLKVVDMEAQNLQVSFFFASEYPTKTLSCRPTPTHHTKFPMTGAETLSKWLQHAVQLYDSVMV